MHAYMDPSLYKAAAEGNIEPFKENEQHLPLLVTPIKNTILHIHITSTNNNQAPKISTNFVEQLLDLCPSLLLQVNAKGETPLHAAAKCGHLAIVEALVMRAKARQMHEELESGGVGYGATCRQMLRTTDNEGNTALHGAVRNGYIDVVEILIKEDPDRCSYCANDCCETPLFIAAERGSFQIVAEILETCTSVAHDGPDGKTALHAAVMSFDLGNV